MSTAHRRKGDETKAEIQEVALELFTERGYEATSMREIAERLQITKAALYYHFRNKEDVVRTLFDDYLSDVDELIAWGREQPPTAGFRAEFLDHWARVAGGRAVPMIRFASANRHAVRQLAPECGSLSERMSQVVALLIGQDASTRAQLRVRVALFSISLAGLVSQDVDIDDEDALDEALDVARDILPGARAPEQDG